MRGLSRSAATGRMGRGEAAISRVFPYDDSRILTSENARECASLSAVNLGICPGTGKSFQ